MLSYNRKNVSITLEGGPAERQVSLSANGALFTVGSGVTLTLDANVTLQGRDKNIAPLVQVNSGGTLVLKDGAKITGNTTEDLAYTATDAPAVAYSFGGAVFVYNGTFKMEGGEISGNSASTIVYASNTATASVIGYSYGWCGNTSRCAVFS
jgi:hypothetical protein